MHWCDICKCWLNDTKAAKMNHERGAGHQSKLAFKLKEMGKKAENEIKQKEIQDIAMSKIDKAAKKAFEADRKAAEAAAGSWEWDAGSSYYYNSTHRWYYEPKSAWYYGGEPEAQWTQAPPIPSAALFGTAKHSGGPVPQGSTAVAPSGPADGGDGPIVRQTVQRVVTVKKHPLADVGGYKAPTSGRVGGSMGSGITLEAEAGAGGSAGAGEKRKREEGGKGGGKVKGEAVSKEEAEALARREAAKARVAARTAAGFGYV
ncbi:hypothetical protein HYH03_010840 [Edaphochlamys debaryana]|uniref:Matrin-type domain-containing protein n=1 Tax=Edaphochlamys debaryana TaxID=47281 RepID=A0A835XYB6_9CHLO|nr:hypothetical protein HYH03_010840 [Edaphochlamys debaryana]|eukprot:KAG2490671.1 hypothetical protein HYH03_010840 [Edaphochlamys debaryana]